MRKTFGIGLVLLLVGSIATNAFLLNRLAKLRQSNDWWQTEVVRAGRAQGVLQANSDFAVGKPAYYVTGQFYIGDLGSPPMLKDKPGRVVVGLGCEVTPFDLAFVESYNNRMDQLFADKPQQQDLPY